MQARSTAADTEQLMDPQELAPVTVHNPSTCYSVVVEERSLS